MVLVTEYRTRPGKRDELFRLFERLLAHRRTFGRDVMMWCDSATERDASFLVEYWSDSTSFARLTETPWYAEYVAAVDVLVDSPPHTTVTVPRWVGGISSGAVS
jgi:quinol monooxygenase YgiN